MLTDEKTKPGTSERSPSKFKVIKSTDTDTDADTKLIIIIIMIMIMIIN